MPDELRRMSFLEIGNGECARVVQEEFERAQKVAEERGLPASVTVKITLAPPKKGERWGQIGYDVETKIPKRTSPAHVAEWLGNTIVGTGRDLAELLQEELPLEMPGKLGIAKEG